MASIVSQIVVVLVSRELSDGSVNWPRIRRRNLPKYSVIYYILYLSDLTDLVKLLIVEKLLVNRKLYKGLV